MCAFYETLADDVALEIVKEVRENEIEVVVACVFPDDGKALVEAFHRIRYPRKDFFLAVGPTKQEWVDDFAPPSLAEDLLSAVQSHLQTELRGCLLRFGAGYAQRYREMFEWPDADVRGGGSFCCRIDADTGHSRGLRSTAISRRLWGDVDALLYNESANQCDGEGSDNGYQRVLDALVKLEMEETFFGGVEFNEYRRNARHRVAEPFGEEPLQGE